jgi:hypothetical protein
MWYPRVTVDSIHGNFVFCVGIVNMLVGMVEPANFPFFPENDVAPRLAKHLATCMLFMG